MSVIQTEEYYIYLEKRTMTSFQKSEIEEYLKEERYTNYLINGEVIVDDFDCESDAERIEEGILEILGRE